MAVQEEDNRDLENRAIWGLDNYDCGVIIKMAIASQDGLDDAELDQVAGLLADMTDEEFARSTLAKVKGLSQVIGWDNLVFLAIGTATMILDQPERQRLLEDAAVVAVGDGELGERELAMLGHLAEAWGMSLEDLFSQSHDPGD
ncbi:MAG: hypothetical protein PHF14_05305 [Verrucomicrobiota bacterium]|jgi:tellurite resistance protein|nr:hypothetical protein [Verrucomicrobiota bacterium]MDD8045860.1 hypothetical protein [Verrucomicrobiota bacterium]MDI9384033.1 hypothetical protein [Verrucomicrobiota bacterium]HCF96768.1 hypothetical protein [Verrucomicrobiota bacterium]